MTIVSRREFLQAAAALAAMGAAPIPTKPPRDKYITCFYQFTAGALKTLSAPEALPNGENFVHIFSQSSPGKAPRGGTADLIHAAGPSFKYAFALDVHKYEGWMTAGDDQLKSWASEFRDACLGANVKVDYWAFNEMPTTGPAKPQLRNQVAKWIRLIHSAGGGPDFKCVFYFTEHNTEPGAWQGDSDNFWAALDETCDLVVGEHYHNQGFVFQKSPEKLAAHFFALPEWLARSGKKPQMNIAEHKYAVLHSSYFGPKETGWEGVIDTTKNGPPELRKYLDHCIAATRASALGKHRIGFGPLAAKEFDDRIVAVLAEALAKDARSG